MWGYDAVTLPAACLRPAGERDNYGKKRRASASTNRCPTFKLNPYYKRKEVVSTDNKFEFPYPTSLTQDEPTLYTQEQVQQVVISVLSDLLSQCQEALMHLDNDILDVKSPSEQKEMLSARDVSEMVKISVPTVYALARCGRIPHKRFGRKLLFPRKAVLDWMQKGD